MDAQDLILTAIDNEKGRILKGRTLLQKKLYFVSVLLNIELGYVPHYYGPYSTKIADSLNGLVSNNFVRESIEVFDSGANVFGERRRHSFSISEDGLKVLNRRKQDGRVIGAFHAVNEDPISNDFDLLSVAAKVHFIAKSHGKITSTQISELAKEYGWNLRQKRINKVLKYLVKLGLAKTD